MVRKSTDISYHVVTEARITAPPTRARADQLADNFATVVGGRYTRGTLLVGGAHACYVREMLPGHNKKGPNLDPWESGGNPT